VDRHRFNKLLENPSLIENEDIRELNEYRKKYPFFQGLYVIVAKALVERNHPKAEAFIKKAAIYSAHRGYLKHIIEDEGFFEEQEEIEDQEIKEVKDSIERTSQDTLASSSDQSKESEVQKESTVVPEVQSEEKKENQPNVEKVEPEQSKTIIEQKTEETASSEVDATLDEIQASKARIEAMLRGETLPVEEEETTERSPVQTSSTSDEAKPITHQQNEPPAEVATVTDPKQQKQIELIEKFIAEDPRIDVKKKASHEADQHQEDLASKSLKSAKDFETETIAKLMLQQGKVKKGLAIYEKLRLKFPEKSAYFADQIESVKSKHND
jgi:chemotaxis protein histidine kinase CheA